MLSRRTRWDAPVNRIALARAERLRSGREILDLTESNPTRAGISYPLDELAEIMSRAAREPYAPDPRGLLRAREALAAQLTCHPDDLVLTASTSEAYSFLFKLLCDPDEEVIAAVPSYPLFEHLAALEMVRLRTFALEIHRRWELDAERVQAMITDRTRAMLVVNPNNPTGSFVSPSEQDSLVLMGLPIVSDEVFLDYPLDGKGRTFARSDALTFALGGLSKSAGLPHYKLGWIRIAGPHSDKKKVREALDLIADSFLSVSTPVQAALPDLLRIAPAVRAAIAERTRDNFAALRTMIANSPSMKALPVEGGWSAVLRVPRTATDEELALRLLDSGVLIHPGYFFDFPRDGFLVISLLVEPDPFRARVERLFAALGRLCGAR
jgi:aspartate/methionine/tyrosine aminotransferase